MRRLERPAAWRPTWRSVATRGRATSIEVISPSPASGPPATLNLRLHHDDLIYIANDADDKVLIVDETAELGAGAAAPRQHVIVMAKTA